jgi:hypothetical protein
MAMLAGRPPIRASKNTHISYGILVAGDFGVRPAFSIKKKKRAGLIMQEIARKTRLQAVSKIALRAHSLEGCGSFYVRFSSE